MLLASSSISQPNTFIVQLGTLLHRRSNVDCVVLLVPKLNLYNVAGFFTFPHTFSIS